MSEDNLYEIRYPSSRQFTFDLGKIGRAKHHIKALLEVDLTEARVKIRQHRQAGSKVSLNAWLIKVIADCAALHPQVCGVNRPKVNKVVVFKDVDVSIVVEREVSGVRVPLPYVVRNANLKTLMEIRAEIESAKSQAIEDEGDYVLGNKSSPLGMRLFVKLPQWLRLVMMQIFILNNPRRVKEMMGSVMVTTVGMVGHTRGWIIPSSMHPLGLALGSLNKQPSVYQGEIQIREILHLTVLIDHDVIDGVPAARFIDDLVRKLESGNGL